jgi:FtsP/CotA-like multicopper oxidase with cupredoxin domain
MMVIGPGQREGLLLQFDSPGTYRVMQYLINNLLTINNETSVPTAFIQVNETSAMAKPVNISSLQFTPGMSMSEDIKDSEIEGKTKTVNFGVGQNMNTSAPFPRFTIDDKLFDVKEITHTMNASSASEWNLTSTLGFHPFHIQ